MNGIIKVIWNKHLVPRAEEHNKLHPLQFGNRKGHTLLDTLLLKDNAAKCSVLLNYDMNHHIKTTAGVSKDSYTHSTAHAKLGEGQGK
eukprot:5091326-Ditylum_brightwellii.AAC.1